MTYVKSGRNPCFRQYHTVDDLNSDKWKVSAKRKRLVARELTAYIDCELHTFGKKKHFEIVAKIIDETNYNELHN